MRAYLEKGNFDGAIEVARKEASAGIGAKNRADHSKKMGLG